MNAPPDPTRGDQILPWARAVNRLLRFLIPRESADVMPKSTTGGTRWEVRSRGRNPGVTLFPFQLLDASDEDGAKIRVRWGMIGFITPAGMSPGDNPPFILPVSGTGFIILGVDLDSDTWDPVSADISASTEEPSNEPERIYQVLGSFDASDGLLITQSVRGSLDVGICAPASGEVPAVSWRSLWGSESGGGGV